MNKLQVKPFLQLGLALGAGMLNFLEMESPFGKKVQLAGSAFSLLLLVDAVQGIYRNLSPYYYGRFEGWGNRLFFLPTKEPEEQQLNQLYLLARMNTKRNINLARPRATDPITRAKRSMKVRFE